MILAGLPVPTGAVAALALLVTDVDAVLAHRLKRAVGPCCSPTTSGAVAKDSTRAEGSFEVD